MNHETEETQTIGEEVEEVDIHDDNIKSKSQSAVESEDTRGTNAQPSSDEEEKDDEMEGQRASERPLYKRKVLKSYITLSLASFINYDSAQKSSNVFGSGGVPSTIYQRRYAVSVSMISLIISATIIVGHLDRFLLKKFWQETMFQVGSRVELVILLFLVIWWSVGTGMQTSVTGIAGDSKGQYSFYFSTWACLVSSFFALDAWLQESADDNGGVKAFVTSWPNRAPAWICIAVLSLSTFVWYIDLWKNHENLDREEEEFIRAYFEAISEGQWYWLIIIATLTNLFSVGFVIMEIFRATKDEDTRHQRSINAMEGSCFFFLAIAWIPTVMVATTPGGPASLIGNAYFSTWLLVIFVFEGLVWFIHDMRQRIHNSLKEKQEEYRVKQQQVLEESRKIKEKTTQSATGLDPARRERSGTEYFDAVDAF